jgi:rhodanese-related sulfurtransferase
VKELSAQEAHAAWTAGEAAIIDVREENEFDAVRVPGVPLIPMSELIGRIHELPEGPLVIMCRSGARSASVAEYLEQEGGREDVANLEGGIIAWASSGLPCEGEPPR